MRHKIQNLIVQLSRRHSRIYLFSYIGSFILMFIVGGLLPYGMRSVTYPFRYEKQKTSGIIEQTVIKESKMSKVRFGSTTYYTYYFYVDGSRVFIPSSDYTSYQEGDIYEFYTYSNSKEIFGDYHNYRWWNGVPILGMELLLITISLFFVFTETNEEELKKKERENPFRIRYDQYTTQELYELCKKQGIPVLSGKKKNRNYLRNCLMQKFEMQTYGYKVDKSNAKIRPLLNILLFIAFIFSSVFLIIHIYYIIYTMT